MIDEIYLELKNQLNHANRPVVLSEKYRNSVLTFYFEEFKHESETILAIAIELSREDGHKAKQDLIMGPKEKINSLVLSPDFKIKLEHRLETLHEAIEEMYD